MKGLNGSYPIASMDVSGTPRNNTRSRTGRSDQTGVIPIREAPPNQLSSLPSPVDAFHRPQAPAPPHVTTPHERAPRVDGTQERKHKTRTTSRIFFYKKYH